MFFRGCFEPLVPPDYTSSKMGRDYQENASMVGKGIKDSSKKKGKLDFSFGVTDEGKMHTPCLLTKIS